MSSSPTTPCASARRPRRRATCGSPTSSRPRRRRRAMPCTPATASSPRTPRSCARARTTTSRSSGRPRTSSSRWATRCARRRRCARPASRSCPARTARRVSKGSVALQRTRASRCCSRRRRAAAERGCGVVASDDELEGAFDAASAEAEAAFGDGSVYVEKLVSPARHVEIQVLCDCGGWCAHARRARVLHPAATPEARRGVALARARRDDARGDGGDRRARVPGDRLPQRRHLRVPRRPGRRLLLHRGELPPPGRAPRVRARHRDRHRPRADPHRRRRAARSERPGAAPRARDRDPDQRGGSRAGLSPSAGHDHAVRPAARAGRASRHGRPLRRGDPAALRLDDREAHRLGRARATRRSPAPSERCASSSIEGIPTTRDLALDVLGSPEFRSGEYSTSTLAELEGRVPSLAPT